MAPTIGGTRCVGLLRGNCQLAVVGLGLAGIALIFQETVFFALSILWFGCQMLLGFRPSFCRDLSLLLLLGYSVRVAVHGVPSDIHTSKCGLWTSGHLGPTPKHVDREQKPKEERVRVRVNTI